MWMHYVGATVFTLLGVISATIGPLLLFEILKRADGRDGTQGGGALTIISVCFVLMALLGWFNVIARRRPLLRICYEGLEINVIGASSLDGTPLIPTWMRAAWAIFSLQGFRKQIGWIPWGTLRNVEVTGLPMIRVLEIEATIACPSVEGEELTAAIGENIAFRDADFRDPLNNICQAIYSFHHDPPARKNLPSIHDI